MPSAHDHTRETNKHETDDPRDDPQSFDEHEDAYPDTLRVTVSSDEQARDRALSNLGRWNDGEEVPHVVSFGSASDLRRLLTPRRIEAMQSIMAEPPASIAALADRLDRNYREVYDDVTLLADYGIVRFRTGTNAKQPVVPYEQVDIDMRVTADEPIV